MLLTYAMTGLGGVILLVSGGVMTIYGVITKPSPRGLSVAIAGLPILACGIGLMAIPLNTTRPVT